MAIIYTYPNKNAPVPDDLIVLTDSEDARKTKRAKLSSLKSGLNVVDSITAVLPVVASSNTKDVTISLSGLTGLGTAGQVIQVNSAANGLEYGDAGSGAVSSLTTLGTSGASTLINGVLNIPVYGSGGGSELTVSQDGTAVDTDVTNLNFISGFAAVDDASIVGKVDVNAVYNTSLADAIATTSDLGGIPSGTTVADLKGDTIVSIFDELLFPTALPLYSIPTRTLSSTVTGTKEVGTTHSPALLAGGTKNDAGIYTDISITKRVNSGSSTTLTSGTPTESSASNLPQQFGFANANNPNKSYGKSVTDTGLVIPAPASGSTSSVVYGSTANYNAGLALKDSKGVDDTRSPAVRSSNNPQAASTGFASINRTITGLYPFYHFRQTGAISTSDMITAIQNGAAVAIVADASGTISIPLAINNQFLAVAYPATNNTKTKYFVTSLDQGAITVVFNAVATSSANSPTGLWSGISFKIHTSNSALTLTGSTMQLRNS